MPAGSVIRFKIDENLPSELSELLIEAGFDSTTVRGQVETAH
jgi:hypothetical protein